MGSQLDVHSEPGKGSTFSLVVRAGDAAKLPQAEGVASSVPRNQLQGKVLVVVEDEADVREGMRVLLEGWGCKVIASDNGDKALQELVSCGVRPDVIIADYRLAGDDTGDRIIASVQEHFGAHVPGVIITGDSAPERLQEALASGYLLLHKPMQPGRLRALLTSLLAETADEARQTSRARDLKRARYVALSPSLVREL